jgi:microcystin-dependent protein
MSFKTSINQRIIDNVFYENTTVDLNKDILDSIASVNYVNDEFLNITNDISDINTTLISLQNQIDTLNGEYSNINNTISSLQNQIDTLNNDIVRTTGTIFISVSSITPSYSLLCDGSSYLVSDYQNLFNVIGYAYGGSDLNFNVPNMKSTFLLGANGVLNGVPASNLISGNGESGALNNYYISGNSYGNLQFPIIQSVPPHSHDYIDNGHSHSIGDYPNYGAFAPSTTEFINNVFSGNSAKSGVSQTGIQINTTGQNIQQTDSYSNISGVNITPPFFSVNFWINI